MRPRLGFVGLGWAGRMRLEAVAAAAEVAALCDPVSSCLEEIAREHPAAPCFTDLAGLLARAGDLRLDGLVIATPNVFHGPQTLAALDRGLAVFCQKPLALSAREARAMVDAAKRADRLLGVDYSYRFTDGARALRSLIERGELGRVFSLDTVFHNAYGPDRAWFYDPLLAGGGSLLDLGAHLIDLAFWLLGESEVEAVHGGAFRAGEPVRAGEIDDFASARIELRSGAAVSLAASWKAHAGRDCVIRAAAFGTAGGAEWRNIDGRFFDFELARFSGRTTEVQVSESRDWLGRAILDWVGRLEASNRFDPEAERSVKVAEVTDAVYGRGPG